MTADDAQVSVDTLREDISTDAVLVTVHAADVRAVLDRLAALAVDNAAMVRHLDALEDPEVADNEVAHLRARVAVLEAQQGEPAGTEWGVRWHDGYVSAERSEEGARREVSATGRELVSRTLGPWRVSS